MEYVQKAIELARKEREAKGESIPEAESPIPPAEEPATREQGATPADAIQYTQTRSIELDSGVLMRNRIVAAFDDERAEPYRQLRTQILRKCQKDNMRTLAITGAHEGAGKTLTAINTAIAIAKEVNQTVLLVDLDFKGPSIAEVLGVSIDVGLVEYLRGECALSDAMINPGLERLVVLPALHMTGPTSEILSSPEMRATLKELVNRYEDRIIIFDLPPLLRDDDALVFTPDVDGTLLVVEQGVTTPDQVERCLHLLKDANVVGTVFNKAA